MLDAASRTTLRITKWQRKELTVVTLQDVRLAELVGLSLGVAPGGPFDALAAGPDVSVNCHVKDYTFI